MLKGYLQLMRPANIITAWADILLGYGASSVREFLGKMPILLLFFGLFSLLLDSMAVELFSMMSAMLR